MMITFLMLIVVIALQHPLNYFLRKDYKQEYLMAATFIFFLCVILLCISLLNIAGIKDF